MPRLANCYTLRMDMNDANVYFLVNIVDNAFDYPRM